MKTALFLVAFAFLICGCSQKEKDQILSVCIFEPVTPDVVATKDILATLKDRADEAYNPNNRPILISLSELENAGYKLRFSSNSPLTSQSEKLFSQGLQTEHNDPQDVVRGNLTADKNGSYEISIFVGDKNDPDLEKKTAKSQIASPGSGTLSLPNGWIAAWSAKSIEG